MIVLDVNVLVAAHRDDHVHHASARPFLTAALADEIVLVPDSIWSGFLRIVTSRRAFEHPTTMDAAVAFVRAVVAAAGPSSLAGLVDGIEPFLRLLLSSGARADVVPDAYIAAVALAHACPVATYDRDFRRFDGLRIVVPT